MNNQDKQGQDEIIEAAEQGNQQAADDFEIEYSEYQKLLED